jgi:small GTP-binding protein
MTSEYDSLMKIILIGDSGVGKTSFFRAFTQTNINDVLTTTIGVDFMNKNIRVNDKLVKVFLWDTAGLERFRELTTQYYRGTKIILLFYDVTYRNSFENLSRWLSSINSILTKEDYTLVIIGTKIDLKEPRAVSKVEAEEYANKIGADYYEVSILTADKTTFEKTHQIIINSIQKYMKTHIVTPKSISSQLVITSEPFQSENRATFRQKCC